MSLYCLFCFCSIASLQHLFLRRLILYHLFVPPPSCLFSLAFWILEFLPPHFMWFLFIILFFGMCFIGGYFLGLFFKTPLALPHQPVPPFFICFTSSTSLSIYSSSSLFVCSPRISSHSCWRLTSSDLGSLEMWLLLAVYYLADSSVFECSSEGVYNQLFLTVQNQSVFHHKCQRWNMLLWMQISRDVSF